MRTLVTGGAGFVGSHLCETFLAMGHEVICVSRQKREPYNKQPIWKSVKQIPIDRTKAEKKGVFGSQIRELKAEVIINLICFTLESAAMLANTAYLSEYSYCCSSPESNCQG